MSAPLPARVEGESTKDLVDHVRTVHFALLTVCAALIIVSLDSKQLPISEALTQATQIGELRKRWNEVQTNAITSAIDPAMRQNYQMVVTIGLPPDETMHPLVFEYTDHEFLGYQGWKFTGAEMGRSPATLREFAHWWDAIHGSTTVNLPDFESINAPPEGMLTIGDVSAPQIMALKVVAGGIDMPPQTAVVQPELPDAFTIEGIGPVPDGMKMPKEVAHSVGEKRIHISERGKLLHKKISEQFVIQLYPSWRAGNYREAFRELAVVAPDLSDIDLQEVPPRIRDLMSKGDEVVEAFGLKIPASEVTLWGTTLLLVTQLYLWLNLHELARRIASSALARDVAWIGVYRSRAAEIVTSTSICILPIGAALSLAVRMAAKGDRGYSAAGVTAAVAVLLLSVLVGVSSGRKLRALQKAEEPPLVPN